MDVLAKLANIRDSQNNQGWFCPAIFPSPPMFSRQRQFIVHVAAIAAAAAASSGES